MNIKITYGLLIVILIIFYSCSSSSNYQVITFLFDGVPSNDTVKVVNDQVVKSDSSTISEQNKIAPFAPAFILHEPYKEKMCESCHDIKASFKKIISLPELCYQCHNDYQSAFKNIHYPVDAGECNSCHQPHQAKLPKLLLQPIRKLCAECHEVDDLFTGDMHSGIGETDCTECHNPHGSNDNALLK